MSRKLILVLLIYLTQAATLGETLPPQNPVIGIFTQTYSNTSTSKSSYIAASYVKFIEMSGGQVVPIYSFAETTEVLALLKKINGVLFTGGDMDFDITGQWTKNADAILNFAKDQNDQGNPFPVFGTCLGLQLFAYLTSNYNNTILTRVHGDQNIILPINLVADGHIFSTLTSTQKEKLTKGGLMLFNHNWAVTLDTFYTNSFLKYVWNLVATATTPQNQDFVAAFEAKRYPFFGVQFHPEKSPFEWKINADRSLEAIQVTQIFSNRFMDVARQNKNKFASAEEFTKLSIYNFKTIIDDYFTQTYVFNEIPRSQGRKMILDSN